MTETVYKSNEQPTRKRHSPWTLRVVVILFIWILIYFFFAGPGRLLFPSLLISYTSVSDQKNTVYFYGDRIEKALDLLWLAAITQDSIKQFWGDTAGGEFNKGVTIFLCESPRQYFHLTWNNAMGSAIMGRVVLNSSRIDGKMSPYSAMVHEMYHIYITRKYGYLPSVLLYPKWFEEGCATLLQDYSVAADKLGENLWGWPTMVTLTSLNHPWSWQTMVRMENGKMVSKGYGQVCHFTRYVDDHYGREKLMDFADRLKWSFSSDKTFEKAFGVPLALAEKQWLQGMVESGEAPSEASFIGLPFDILIFLRWAMIVFVILFPFALLGRWGFLMASRRKKGNNS